jgi:hypothetical protein
MYFVSPNTGKGLGWLCSPYDESSDSKIKIYFLLNLIHILQHRGINRSLLTNILVHI